jgi:hypothetical protein
MSLNSRKSKTRNLDDRSEKAEKIAISLGAKRFDPEDAIVDTDFEIEEFLEWRSGRRNADVEAQKDCQL